MHIGKVGIYDHINDNDAKVNSDEVAKSLRDSGNVKNLKTKIINHSESINSVASDVQYESAETTDKGVSTSSRTVLLFNERGDILSISITINDKYYTGNVIDDVDAIVGSLKFK